MLNRNDLYPWLEKRRYLWTPAAICLFIIWPLAILHYSLCETWPEVKESILEIKDLMIWRVK